MIKQVTSPQNPLIREVVRLRSKSRARRERGLCVIEGLREVERAARSGVHLETLLYRPELISPDEVSALLSDHLARTPSDVNVHNGERARSLMHIHCTPAVMERVAYRADVPNLVALGRRPETHALSARPEGAQPDLLLILEGVEKPGNLGALLRTADALGVTGVILVDCPVEPDHPNVIRNSLGAAFSLEVVSLGFEETLSLLRERGVTLYVTHLTADAIPPERAPLHEACALMLGAESIGARDRWLDQAPSQPLIIPMRAGRVVDSLNVSVAASIVIYEAARQRRC